MWTNAPPIEARWSICERPVRLRVRPDRVRGGEIRGDAQRGRSGSGFRKRMAPTAGADRMPVCVRRDIEDDVVIMCRADAAGNIVQVERMADLPGDDVVRAGSVAAHTEGAHDVA